MKTVEMVEESILKEMAKLIPLPAECYKTQITESSRRMNKSE
jgi:hypothetical protein